MIGSNVVRVNNTFFFSHVVQERRLVTPLYLI